MTLALVVADTGMGNIRSVVRALGEAAKRSATSVTVEVSGDADVVRRADALVVPGQGAFRDCATALSGGLGDSLREAITRGTPYLGICLGMQALFASSEEAPGCTGLGIFSGSVVKLRGGGHVKIPHVGWNAVEPTHETWLLDRTDYFYFVHSYVAACSSALACGMTEHGERFVSAIEKDNVAAVQFHPEKSQRAGLALLERFLKRSAS